MAAAVVSTRTPYRVRAPINAEDCLACAAALAGETDAAGLLRRLAALLPSILGSRTLHVYGFPDRPWTTPPAPSEVARLRLRDLAAGEDAPVLRADQIQGLARAMANGDQTLLRQGKGWRLIQTLPAHGRICACLVADLDHDPGAQLAAIRDLAVIAGHQLALLNRSQTDTLTGLFNRQAFDRRLDETLAEMGAQERRQLPVGRGQVYLALLDIDHFKRINDRLGHLYGDEVLILFARLMQGSFRRHDWLFRYGGEEFAILLEGADLATVGQVLDRFRRQVARHRFPQIPAVTVSIGYAGLRSDLPRSLAVERADRALYHAKDQGRNRVVSWEEVLAAGGIDPQHLEYGQIDLF